MSDQLLHKIPLDPTVIPTKPYLVDVRVSQLCSQVQSILEAHVCQAAHSTATRQLWLLITCRSAGHTPDTQSTAASDGRQARERECVHSRGVLALPLLNDADCTRLCLRQLRQGCLLTVHTHLTALGDWALLKGQRAAA